jgi:hypothetical protein
MCMLIQVASSAEQLAVGSCDDSRRGGERRLTICVCLLIQVASGAEQWRSARVEAAGEEVSAG